MNLMWRIARWVTQRLAADHLAAKDAKIRELNDLLDAALVAAARTNAQARDSSVAGAEESARRWRAEYERVQALLDRLKAERDKYLVALNAEIDRREGMPF